MHKSVAECEEKVKILVLGGSYFLGKTFVRLAAEYNEIYVLNRGNQPLYEENVIEYVMDRHDIEAISGIPEKDFDVVVDFCGYNAGDIKIIFDNLKASFSHYVFVSTCDVYRRGSGKLLDESAPFEERYFGGAAGDYISGKVALEKELKECCMEKNTAYTSIRPAFIYGPDNYAPRESMYFNWIVNAGQIIHPYDATGHFQMAFVLDVAKAILLVCGNKTAYNRAYNICDSDFMTYESFADLMEEVLNMQFERLEMSVEDVIARNIMLPFPLTKEEAESYDGTAIKELGFSYTPIEKGMAVTADYYINS